MILKLSLCLPEDIGFVRTARLLSRTLLEDIRVVRVDIEAVETIIGELCTNVIRHAHAEPAKYDIVLEYYEQSVVLTVVDHGAGFHLEDVARPGTARPDLYGGTRYGGFGLPLLWSLSDKLNFSVTNPHGTTVRVEKALHYVTEEDRREARSRDTAICGVVELSTP